MRAEKIVHQKSEHDVRSRRGKKSMNLNQSYRKCVCTRVRVFFRSIKIV